MELHHAREWLECWFRLSSLANSRPRPVYVLLFALFLACLALLLLLPRCHWASIQPHSILGLARIRSQRWAFLAMKISCLILNLIGFLSLAVISFDALVLTAEGAACTELFTSFAGLLFSFRWALRDQRLRCPVRLNLLTSPARVGHPSRSFLAWHGTELFALRVTVGPTFRKQRPAGSALSGGSRSMVHGERDFRISQSDNFVTNVLWGWEPPWWTLHAAVR